MENIDIDIDIDKDNLKNIDIDIDIDMAILDNIDIDIDKGILQNIDIDKISYRLGFGISNTPSITPSRLICVCHDRTNIPTQRLPRQNGGKYFDKSLRALIKFFGKCILSVVKQKLTLATINICCVILAKESQASKHQHN